MSEELIKYFTKENFASETKGGVVLVDFFADWCGPCRMLAPVLDLIAQEVKGKVRVGKLDIEQAMELTESLQITTVPTMILFKDGKEFKRAIGLRDADYVRDLVQSALV